MKAIFRLFLTSCKLSALPSWAWTVMGSEPQSSSGFPLCRPNFWGRSRRYGYCWCCSQCTSLQNHKHQHKPWLRVPQRLHISGLWLLPVLVADEEPLLLDEDWWGRLRGSSEPGKYWNESILYLFPRKIRGKELGWEVQKISGIYRQEAAAQIVYLSWAAVHTDGCVHWKQEH